MGFQRRRPNWRKRIRLRWAKVLFGYKRILDEMLVKQEEHEVRPKVDGRPAKLRDPRETPDHYITARLGRTQFTVKELIDDKEVALKLIKAMTAYWEYAYANNIGAARRQFVSFNDIRFYAIDWVLVVIDSMDPADPDAVVEYGLRRSL